ncbi:MAG: stage II sporulation protein M [Clostridia bacterium]|nr:stage II sporulation protein M [Clostridia bacterium]
MKETIENHFKENYKSYLYYMLVFIIGVTIGIIAVNNLNIENKEKINNYLIEFSRNIKEQNNINYGLLLKHSISNNIKFIGILIILSLSIWRKLSTSILIGYKGFSLGYAISSVILILGMGKGIVFNISLILLSEIIFIPTIIFTGIFCINNYNQIIKSRTKNISLIKYIIVFMLIIFSSILSSLIKTFLSTNLFLMLNNYF